MGWIFPIHLQGQVAALEPLSLAHADDLAAAVADGQLWRLWYTTIPAPDGVADEIERRISLLHDGLMLPFAVRHLDTGRLVGMTNFLNIDARNKRVEIGATWYAASVQRSALNTEVKLMLLRYAFETLACIAVEFRTHFFNQASRRAIERLGAKLDGVLRNHSVMPDGTLRDTCVYSILNSEWPTVRTHLNWQLSKRRS